MKIDKKSLFLLILFMLTSCCYKTEYNSLEEYKKKINETGLGYSSFELDKPEYFLPGNTFLEDFSYLNGEYFFYEKSAFCDICGNEKMPDRVLLALEYDTASYYDAKEFVISNIPKYENYSYSYYNYHFYMNGNFMERFSNEELPEIPNWFTMVSYNDLNNMICFLGFHNSYPELDEKYLNDLENNWQSFIDQYYGKYYDFSE